MRKTWMYLAVPVLLAGALTACGADEENVQPIGSTTTVAGQPTSIPSVPPKTYQGSGNQKLDIQPPVPGTPFAAKLTNSVAGPFVVDAVDATGQPSSNLVDTTGTYTGTVPIDFNPSLAKTVALDIQAPGAWTVELQALERAAPVHDQLQRHG